ncbi:MULTISPECIES: hypothetical protein [Okeania]|uniref:Uncharacterized protein n=1 Tax=Okeania hirsuta TaxID=1458930 RepID=A0A3N6NX14_9CYAN|nr:MULTISPECIES: hypothetical protein [Okeania]NET15578.1 hypothetical protein [Okeania sp. SIO1H6]NES78500.1 hypothetical protein [Okeania sp. SIO1H4]NES92808.1 hypothetical protein [Okeania sp. SIO2B9]NET22030.1 hypothetical protein [Okeania sp. SIO1H5]NET78507.1 hypothetical protein [Okeania sp. SIO1F9]
MTEESELVQLIIENFSEILRYLQQQYDELPPELKKVVESIPDFLSDLETDSQLINKREVYEIIAEFLQKNLNEELPLCLDATHIICEENDPRLLKERTGDAEKLAEDAKELILSIKVHYELLKNLTYNRKTEFFYHKKNQPAVKKVEEELDWDRIPGDVRSSYLIEGQKISTFKLYPIE